MKSILLIITRLAIVNAIFLVATVFFLAWLNKPVNLSAKMPPDDLITENSVKTAETKTKITQIDTKPVVSGESKGDSKTHNEDTAKEEPPPVPEKKDPFAELGSHNSPSDCWIAYSGHLYNITSAFGSHPGGDASLAKYCGRDATSGFDTKDKSPASSHSQAAKQMLAQYLIQ